MTWSGTCKDGYIEGPGLLEWFDSKGAADGWRKGNFFGGKLEGNGELQTAKGSHYRGHFREGLQSGRGELVFADGTSYVGQFRNGQAEGIVRVLWPNGLRYDGEFKQGKANGRGTVVDPSGASYVGMFKEGRAEGHGTVRRPDGSSFSIEIIEGRCVGTMTPDYTASSSSHKPPDDADSRSSFCATASQTQTSLSFSIHSLSSVILAPDVRDAP